MESISAGFRTNNDPTIKETSNTDVAAEISEEYQLWEVK